MTTKVKNGTAGDDKIMFSPEEGADMAVFGLGGNDFIWGSVNDDTIDGGDGNDELFGWIGEDTLKGGKGDDILRANSDGDRLFGGVGNDTYYLGDEVTNAVVWEDAGSGLDTVVFRGDSYKLSDNIEQLFASTGMDHGVHLFGNALSNLVIGTGHNDQLSGGAGDDTLEGGAGNDQLYGDAGNDHLFGGPGVDSLWGGTGNDTYHVDAGDQIFEAVGAGIDTMIVTNGNHDMAANVENLIVNGAGALVVGNGLGNTMSGGDGQDNLFGMAGNDVLSGGEGNDTLVGGEGNDSISGGGGHDMLLGGTGDDTIDAGAGDDIVTGEDGRDVIDGGSGEDVLRGREGDDTLDGGIGDDELFGDEGEDRLIGRDGTDILHGGAGEDVLFGLQGNDVLEGGAGADTLIGGGDSDRFVFTNVQDSTTSARDMILDFQPGSDLINLSIIDASTLKGGNNAFTFSGMPSFFDDAGVLSMSHGAGRTYVSADVNGDATVDFSLELWGVFNLTAADFIL